jgi:hypothetical protein
MIQAGWDETTEALADDVASTKRYVMRSLVALSKAGKQEGSRLKALELLGRASGMWQAQQAEAEAKQKAERAAANKSASKRSSSKSKPPKRLPPPLQHVTAPVAKADEKTSPANKPQIHKAQAHTAQPPSAQPAQPTAKPALSTATPAAKPPLSATAAVPQAVGAVRAAAAQPALPATLPNTRFKAVSAPRA